MTMAMGTRMRAWFVTVGMVVVASAPAMTLGATFTPPRVDRVLVLPFGVSMDPTARSGAGASLWLGEAASILLEDRLRQAGVAVFSRDERVAAFDRLQMPMSAALTRATMIRIGEVIGASEIVFGELRLGDAISVRAHMIRLDVGRQLPEVADTAPLADLFPLFDRVGGRLGTATGRVTGARASAIAQPIAVFEPYVKGLVAATPAAQQRFLETAMKQSPRDARVLTALWAVYAAQGLHEKALSVAADVPADSPLSRKARFLAALSLIELKRFDGAFKALTAMNQERPSTVLNNAVGIVQLRRGNATEPATPMVFFKKAATDEPSNTDYLFNLGYAYALAKDSANAVQWLRESVRYDASNGEDHLVLSAVLTAAGKTVEAERELALAKLLGTRLDLTTATPTATVPPGLERLSTDLDIPPAQRVTTTGPAQREQQETATFYLERGRRLFQQQQDREAINELRRAVYLSPYEDAPHMLLGQLYQRGGRLPDAIDEFKIAIWCRDTADARVALGAALLESGDPVAARKEAERALVLAPSSEAARALLKKIGGVLPSEHR